MTSLKFPSILIDFFGDFDLAWKCYMRPVGVLAVLMLILRFINASPYSGDLKLAVDFIVQATALFLLGCFFADLKETPWPPTVEMLAVFGLCFSVLYLGNLALGFIQQGASVFQYASSLEAAALVTLSPLPFGFTVRKLTHFIFPSKKSQVDEQPGLEDSPEIRPI